MKLSILILTAIVARATAQHLHQQSFEANTGINGLSVVQSTTKANPSHIHGSHKLRENESNVKKSFPIREKLNKSNSSQSRTVSLQSKYKFLSPNTTRENASDKTTVIEKKDGYVRKSSRMRPYPYKKEYKKPSKRVVVGKPRYIVEPMSGSDDEVFKIHNEKIEKDIHNLVTEKDIQIEVADKDIHNEVTEKDVHNEVTEKETPLSTVDYRCSKLSDNKTVCSVNHENDTSKQDDYLDELVYKFSSATNGIHEPKVTQDTSDLNQNIINSSASHFSSSNKQPDRPVKGNQDLSKLSELKSSFNNETMSGWSICDEINTSIFLHVNKSGTAFMTLPRHGGPRSCKTFPENVESVFEAVNSTYMKATITATQPSSFMLQCKDQDTGAVLCERSAFAGYPPLDVQDFDCISNNMSELDCWYTIPANPATLSTEAYSVCYATADIECYDTVDPYFCDSGEGDVDCCGNLSLGNNDECLRWPTYEWTERYLNFTIKATNALGTSTYHRIIDSYASVIPAKVGHLKVKYESSNSANIYYKVSHHMKYLPPGVKHRINVTAPYTINGSDWSKSLLFYPSNKSKTIIQYPLRLPFPGTQYTVSVELLSGLLSPEDAPHWRWSRSATVTVETLPDRPAKSPKLTPDMYQEIAGSSPNERSVGIFWKPLEPQEYGGQNFHYLVQLFDDNDTQVLEATTSGCTYLFKDLKTSSSYKAVVYSVNTIGASVHPGSLHIKGQSDGPSAPTLPIVLRVAGQGPVNYWLRWYSATTEPLNYTIMYCVAKASRDTLFPPCTSRLHHITVGAVTAVNISRTELNLSKSIRDESIIFAVAAQMIDSSKRVQSSGLAWARCHENFTVVQQAPMSIQQTEVLDRHLSSVRVRVPLDCRQQSAGVMSVQLMACELTSDEPVACDKLQQTSTRCTEWEDVPPWAEEHVILALKSSTTYSLYKKIILMDGTTGCDEPVIFSTEMALWLALTLSAITVIVVTVLMSLLAYSYRYLHKMKSEATVALKPPDLTLAEDGLKSANVDNTSHSANSRIPHEKEDDEYDKLISSPEESMANDFHDTLPKIQAEPQSNLFGNWRSFDQHNECDMNVEQTLGETTERCQLPDLNKRSVSSDGYVLVARNGECKVDVDEMKPTDESFGKSASMANTSSFDYLQPIEIEAKQDCYQKYSFSGDKASYVMVAPNSVTKVKNYATNENLFIRTNEDETFGIITIAGVELESAADTNKTAYSKNWPHESDAIKTSQTSDDPDDNFYVKVSNCSKTNANLLSVIENEIGVDDFTPEELNFCPTSKTVQLFIESTQPNGLASKLPGTGGQSDLMSYLEKHIGQFKCNIDELSLSTDESITPRIASFNTPYVSIEKNVNNFSDNETKSDLISSSSSNISLENDFATIMQSCNNFLQSLPNNKSINVQHSEVPAYVRHNSNASLFIGNDSNNVPQVNIVPFNVPLHHIGPVVPSLESKPLQTADQHHSVNIPGYGMLTLPATLTDKYSDDNKNCQPLTESVLVHQTLLPESEVDQTEFSETNETSTLYPDIVDRKGSVVTRGHLDSADSGYVSIAHHDVNKWLVGRQSSNSSDFPDTFEDY